MTEYPKFIREFLEKHNMKPSAFGRLFAGDPAHVDRVRGGVETRLVTKIKVLDRARAWEKEQDAQMEMYFPPARDEGAEE
jgi:hypothetical protein